MALIHSKADSWEFDRLSTMITSYQFSIKTVAVWEPIYPSPHVIRIFFFCPMWCVENKWFIFCVWIELYRFIVTMQCYLVSGKYLITCRTNLSASLYLFSRSSADINTIEAFSIKNSLNNSEIQFFNSSIWGFSICW